MLESEINRRGAHRTVPGVCPGVVDGALACDEGPDPGLELAELQRELCRQKPVLLQRAIKACLHNRMGSVLSFTASKTYGKNVNTDGQL